MAFQRQISKVPASMVAQVVEDFESEGAIVTQIPDGDGTFTIVATFP